MFFQVTRIVLISIMLMPVYSYGAVAGYRCTSEERGGYQHEKNDHRLTKFAEGDYRIVTFSEIPDEAIPMLVTMQESRLRIDVGLSQPYSSLKISDLRKAYTKIMDKRSYVTDLIEIYIGKSFLRSTSSDPSLATSYTSCVQDITWKSKRDKNAQDVDKISCNSGDHNLFQFQNGRFSSAYLGSWHAETKSSSYSGDSSVFNFGYCVLYYD